MTKEQKPTHSTSSTANNINRHLANLALDEFLGGLAVGMGTMVGGGVVLMCINQVLEIVVANPFVRALVEIGFVAVAVTLIYPACQRLISWLLSDYLFEEDKHEN